MQTGLRHLLFGLIFLGAVSIERALGLPFLSLVLASNYLSPTNRIGKTVGIVFCGVFLAISYLIPIWLGLAVIAGLVFVLEHRVIFFQRETLTYFTLVILGGSLVGVVSHYPISLGNVIYHLLLAIFCLFIIRFWLMKKASKWKTV